MKAYNLTAVSIEIAGITKTVVSLGEKGRGRSQCLVNVPIGLENSDLVSYRLPKPGMPGKAVVSSGGSSEGWLARVSTEGAYVRGANGNVSAAADSGVILVAQGSGAFGDAGRTGVWTDSLLAVPDNTALRVKPSRGDAYVLWFAVDKVSRLSFDEAELLELPIGSSTASSRGDFIAI